MSVGTEERAEDEEREGGRGGAAAALEEEDGEPTISSTTTGRGECGCDGGCDGDCDNCVVGCPSASREGGGGGGKVQGKERVIRGSISESTCNTSCASSVMDEDEYYPKTLQDELNEILEAFYDMVSEDDIRQYQRFVEDIQNKRVAEGAANVGDVAPDFELEDQDGEIVSLDELCSRGPVVLVFYRGKWCPHCNAHIMRLQRMLPQIKAKGATLVAISPMLPDGTHYLATKRSLEFAILSDVGNAVAEEFRIAFQVDPSVQDDFLKWGEDVPAHNGDGTWKVPLPATYIVDRGDARTIVYAHVDNDPGVRAEPDDVVDAIPVYDDLIETDAAAATEEGDKQMEPVRKKTETAATDTALRKSDSTAVIQPSRKFNRGTGFSFKFPKKKLFGRKKQNAQSYLSHYLLPPASSPT